MFFQLRWRLALPFLVVIAFVGAALWAGLALLAGVGAPGNLLGRFAAVAAGVVVFGAVVAILIAARVARSIVDPLDRCVRLAEQVASGDLDGSAAVDRLDDINRLARAMNDMVFALRKAFQSLRHESAELEAILASMADGVIIVDHLGLIVGLNPAAERLIGAANEQARGRSLSSVTRLPELNDHFDPATASSAPLVVEIGPERRQVQVVVTSMGGRPTERVIVLQDVTALRQAEAMRRDFVANVSHELRTPLASLHALVETLEDGALDDPPAAREFLGRMHGEVDGLTQMVEELLELARIESGRVRLRIDRNDLVDLAHEAVDRLRPQAERNEVRLVVHPSVGPIDANVDRDRFGQVFVNLIHNAIKFTPPGGTVRVTVEPRPGAVAVTVSDTGIGIPSEDLRRIFERFYKADRARSSPGTGLGLAIVKHLVQIHQGEVWAESPGPGRGATFTVILPR